MARIIHGDKTLEQVAFSKEAQLERVVVENSERIFGRDAIYFDLKKLISSGKSKKRKNLAAIPDGYLLTLGKTPTLTLVEVELIGHDPFRHIAAQLATFRAVVSNETRWELAAILEADLKANPDKMAKLKKCVSTEIIKMLHASINPSKIPIIMVINGVDDNIDKISEQFSARVYVVQKFKNGKNDVFHIVDPNDLNGTADVSLTEAKYLRKYPKTKGLWMEAKNRIEGKFPDAKFEMTAVVGKYKSLNGRTLCWLQATGKKINLAYGIKVGDKILSESPFVKDVSDVGKNFSGEYRSSIKNTDDIEKVLPLLDNIWGFHAGKYGRGYTQIYDV